MHPLIAQRISDHVDVLGKTMDYIDVIAEAADRHYDGKIIIGGAAVTPSFSEEIGADGYSKDAADCVKLVSRLLS